MNEKGKISVLMARISFKLTKEMVVDFQRNGSVTSTCNNCGCFMLAGMHM